MSLHEGMSLLLRTCVFYIDTHLYFCHVIVHCRSTVLIGIDFNRSGNLPSSYPSTLVHQVSFQCAEDGPLIGSTLVTWASYFSCSVDFVWQCDVFFSQMSSYDMFCDDWVSDLWLIVYVTTIKILTQLWFKHGNLRTIWFTNLSWGSLLCRFSPLPRWVRACISSSWSVGKW